MPTYTTLAYFTYPTEMAIARSFLEAEGIHTFVRDELTVQVHNFYSNAIGGIRLEVPEEDLEKAEDLLWEHGYGEYLANCDRFASEETPFSFMTLLKHLPWWVYIIPILVLVWLAISSFF